MINSHTSKIIYDFYNIFSKYILKESEDLNFNTNLNNKGNLPEIFNLDSQIIFEIIENIKALLPDQLNTSDASPTLFKVNKFNEFQTS